MSLILHVPLHVTYIQSLSKSKDDLAYHLTSHLRLNAIYWGLTALSILNHPKALDRQDTIDFVLSCWDDEAGAFAAHPGHDAHVLSTTSAVQVMVIHGAIERVDVERVVRFILSLQQPTGVFAGDSFGETDTRFSYCAVNTLSLLGKLSVLDDLYPSTDITRNDTTQITRKDLLTAHILRCNNFDGGFGSNEGAESHAAQVFVCLASLAILGRLGEIGFGVSASTPPSNSNPSAPSPKDSNRSTPSNPNPQDPNRSEVSTPKPSQQQPQLPAPKPSAPSTYQTLAWWLAERQLPNGGLNGRPEKLEDVSSFDFRFSLALSSCRFFVILLSWITVLSLFFRWFAFASCVGSLSLRLASRYSLDHLVCVNARMHASRPSSLHIPSQMVGRRIFDSYLPELSSCLCVLDRFSLGCGGLLSPWLDFVSCVLWVTVCLAIRLEFFLMHGCTDGWMHGWMDRGWGCSDGCMDGQMHASRPSSSNPYPELYTGKSSRLISSYLISHGDSCPIPPASRPTSPFLVNIRSCHCHLFFLSELSSWFLSGLLSLYLSCHIFIPFLSPLLPPSLPSWLQHRSKRASSFLGVFLG